jgi:hypothetical protein
VTTTNSDLADAISSAVDAAALDAVDAVYHARREGTISPVFIGASIHQSARAAATTAANTAYASRSDMHAAYWAAHSAAYDAAYLVYAGGIK